MPDLCNPSEARKEPNGPVLTLLDDFDNKLQEYCGQLSRVNLKLENFNRRLVGNVDESGVPSGQPDPSTMAEKLAVTLTTLGHLIGSIEIHVEQITG